ncbi:MAG TPA: EamA family transporter [Bryobacteraceae bacterium]|jgi:inner membrane transporter RhtA|nr:EamA family transporter [Bryobacteraceae bacterium]
MLSVQGGAALAKDMFPALGPANTVTLRIVLSALVLGLVFRPRIHQITAAQWRIVIPYGVILALMNLTFYLALARIPLGLAVTVEFTGPLAVAVLGSRRAQDFLWVLLAITGIALIAPWHTSRNIDPVGVLLALVAAVGWASYILVGARVSRAIPAGPGVAIGMLVASAVILPIGLAHHVLSQLTFRLLVEGLGVAILSSALPYSFEMIALRSIPAKTFGILMSLEPAIGALSGLLLLRERLSSAQWTAVLLVMAASAGATWASKKAEVFVEA